MKVMLLQATESQFFGEADLVHGYFQLPDPDDAQSHTFRGADAHSLYEQTKDLQGFKNSNIHMRVHSTDLFAQIEANILSWINAWLLRRKTFIEPIDMEENSLELCIKRQFVLNPTKRD